jgi:hypothetical protein
MAAQAEKKVQWTEIGRSTTSPTKNTERKEVKVDDYYVVVGFEVNNPSAFVDNTQDLAKDFGHAFFYLIKNNLIDAFFSFGPAERGKVGWFGWGSETDPNAFNRGVLIKDGSKGRRKGKPDYGIGELVKAFKIPLPLKQGMKLAELTKRMQTRITSGKQMYTAYFNDTCAETARDLLSDAGIETPNARGWVKYSGSMNFPVAYADNPYMWHNNFTKSKLQSGIFLPPPPNAITGQKWIAEIGNPDPISGFKNESI